MRIAALYDVHGNLPALEAVLGDQRCAGADAIVCGGDLVAGPMPRECLRLLLDRGSDVTVLRGNGERLVATGADAANAWCRERLGLETARRLAAAPLTCSLEVDGLGATVFCHATPRSDEEIVTRITPAQAVLDAFGGLEGTAVVGHTHVQYDRVVCGLRLVNAGSVGWPYEGRQAAFWTLLGPDVEPCATPYDAEAAAAAIRATGWPGAEDLAGSLLSPLASEEATGHFEERRGA